MIVRTLTAIPLPWRALALLPAALFAAPAAAQEEPQEPRRTRIGVGAQLVPSYPGSDKFSLRPLFDISRTRGDEPYEFEAADEAFGFPMLRAGGFEVGPALGIEGSRSPADVGALLPRVGFTVEVGGFVQYVFSDAFRARLEVRKGLGGHKGVIGVVGADYVARDGNDWLVSVGPRLTLADKSYQDAYFSVAPEDAGPSGLPAFSAGAGIQAVGGVVGYTQQLSKRWGIYSYAKYDRLLGDAGRSPIVRELGSRDQFSGGLALTYTFGRDL